jgi:hypothetical protein
LWTAQFARTTLRAHISVLKKSPFAPFYHTRLAVGLWTARKKRGWWGGF